MALADTYATIIRGVPQEKVSGYLPRLLAFMKARGHLSLLPTIVRILEREPNDTKVTVVVAREHDAKKFAQSISESLKLLGTEEKPLISVDPHIVGGHIVRTGSHVVDKSFRNALVQLYRKVVAQ